VPDSELRVRPGESHLGSLDAADEILDAILACWSARGSVHPDSVPGVNATRMPS
jgi:hypothetical protein